jgi:uncharacterized LabA/DUF88 family protein
MHLYIDGESHYIRTEQWVRETIGRDVSLPAYAERRINAPERSIAANRPFFVEPRCKFFWWVDHWVNHRSDNNRKYFTSCAGDEDALHAMRLLLRQKGFEPHILKERMDLARQRENALGNEGIIEKAKGVDIALAVRLLEDAQRDVFTECWLYTSDVDYLPVIEAALRMGKVVHVLGYRSGLGKHSPLEYVPSSFHDLAPEMDDDKSRAGL